jgi:hypothetical protein
MRAGADPSREVAQGKLGRRHSVPSSPNGSSANHIATVLAGSMVEPGASGQRIDHYSLLRTLEDKYGLPPLGAAADAAPLTGSWR